MARDGMTAILTTLRDWTDSGTAEYSDAKLLAILDSYRRDIIREPLAMLGDPEPGVVTYRDYRFSAMYMEQAESGDSAWRVENSVGEVAGTALYSVNYDARSITFTGDTKGTAYTLTGRAYDLHRAAAQVWRMKAAAVAGRFDVKTDNHELKRAQLLQHYQQMARNFEQQSPARSVRRVRDDADF